MQHIRFRNHISESEENMDKKEMIIRGKTALGIELGSTRIKGVLIDLQGNVLAVGIHDWENSFIDNIWTYSLEEIHAGVRKCYSSLRKAVENAYGVVPETYGAIGVSAMMHGYMALDKDGNQIAPFQTWRNTNTQQAADELTELFDFNIPLRWSVAHLYQRILDGEEHVKALDYVGTLSAYIHWKLTGKKVIGIGDASGMFPIDIEKKDFNEEMIQKFDELTADRNYPWKLRDIMPKVMTAGETAGTLTEEGARLLDESGSLEAGILLCPPEGDAGTGMAATNSVAQRTGNVSAGTSVFAMIVLEKELKKVYPEIDLVTTPDGSLVAMVHANNCTSDLNAWVGIFREFAESFGIEVDMNKLFGTLYNKALEGDADCGGLLSYGYLSGEFITGVDEGRPLFVRSPESRFNLANFMRVNLFTALGAIKAGMDLLLKEEDVAIDSILGHGGLFKTKGVGQRILAAAINAPVSVMETAGEGGPWGMALLAAYMLNKADGESLKDYLADKVFEGNAGSRMEPDARDVEGYEVFIERYKKGVAIEKEAIRSLI